MTNPQGYTTAKVAPASVPGQPAEASKQFSLADVDPVGRTEALIYGPPGSGKTVLAATMPAPFRWLAADGQTSLKSIRWAFKEGHTQIKNPETDLIAYTPSEDFGNGLYPDKATAFNKMTDMLDFWFSRTEVDKWQTLVLDSATEISEWALYLGLGLNSQLPSPGSPLSKSHEINKKAKVRILTGQQDYKSAMALFEGFLADVRINCARHGKNLAVLCHEWTEEREREDGTMSVVRREPLLIGQLRTRVTKAFDDVWHLETFSKGGKMDVKVRVHEDNISIAKTRWGQCLDNLEVANYQHLIEKVRKYHAG